MKLLFVTARWDPKSPDDGAGVNYNAYVALQKHIDDIKIVGPFNDELTLFERGINKLSQVFLKKRLIKFYPSYIKKSNQSVQNAINAYSPDVIFSKASIPLVNVKLKIPFVYICDSSVKWVKENWPVFSKFGLEVMEKWERKVIHKANHIVTFSQANADVLTSYYKKPVDQITVHPIPSAIPLELSGYVEKQIGKNQTLKLLIVGRDFHGKGVDIAIETTHLLNQENIPTDLRVVGLDGKDQHRVKFMGLYSKSDPQQLVEYTNQYQWAHFHIFPSRFDAAGIVPSEAAGFGVPTITNAAGGLATTVQNGVSGIVLEKHSPASAYVDVLKYYYQHPNDYQNLCQSTYERYQTELNWDVLGKRLAEIIKNTVNTHQT